MPQRKADKRILRTTLHTLQNINIMRKIEVSKIDQGERQN